MNSISQTRLSKLLLIFRPINAILRKLLSAPWFWAMGIGYVSGWLLVCLSKFIPYHSFQKPGHSLRFWDLLPGGLPQYFRALTLFFGFISGLWWWRSARATSKNAIELNKGAAASTAIAVVCSIATNDMTSRVAQLSALSAIVLLFFLADDIWAAVKVTRKELWAALAVAGIVSLVWYVATAA